MTTRLTDAELRAALKDSALLLGMERDLPPETPLGHKRLELLEIGDCAMQELLEARAAMDAAMARLMDTRTLNMNDPDWPHTGAQAQTIGGDAWRILSEARNGA